MAEAFVKTFKRDYVRVSPIPDAATALALIDAWMEDYNSARERPQDRDRGRTRGSLSLASLGRVRCPCP